MKNIAIGIIILLLFLPTYGFSEIKEIISEGSYNMGDGETPSIAESRAILDAKRIALEQAGTYVQSYSKAKNFILTEDEVMVLAAGIIEVAILDKKRTVVGDGFRFWVKIKAKVNSDKMEEMAKNVKEKSVIEDYKKISREYEKNQREIEELKKQLAHAKGETEKKKVETKIAGEEKLFKANEWFEKGYRHTVTNELNSAIEEYTKAISLNPDYAEAYNNRAISYYNRALYTADRSQIEQAMKDFGKVITLKPGSYSAHFAHGAIYMHKEQYDKAIAELNKAIAINPDEGVAYVGRGFIYMNRKQPEKAVEDFNTVISMGGPWSAIAYFNRGTVSITANQYERAIEDYTKSIELGPRNSQAYSMRAVALFYKKQYNAAIADLNRAIEIAPNNADAYNKRGLIYAQIGNPKAISDFQKACDMAHEEGCTNLQIFLKNR